MFIPVSDRDLTRRSFPIVNLSIIAICALVFIYELAIANSNVFFYRFGLVPFEITQGTTIKFICGNYLYSDTPPWFLSTGCEDVSSPIPTWATMFTAMFIHGGWLHLLGNMIFLWVFGDNIEDRFGHLRYLLFYLVCGIAALGLQIAIDTNSLNPTIGASGAIAGVLGAYLILYPYSRVDTIVFITIVKIPAIALLGLWFMLQFFSGIGEMSSSANASGVAYWAHIGGFFFGMVVAIIYKLIKKEQLWPWDSGGNSGPPAADYWQGEPASSGENNLDTHQETFEKTPFGDFSAQPPSEERETPQN
jgi:membrane associated rhomboid family serine protease